MTPRESYEPADNRAYQRRLAASLVDCLGHDGAVRACQANSWDGVLACIPAEAARSRQPGAYLSIGHGLHRPEGRDQYSDRLLAQPALA